VSRHTPGSSPIRSDPCHFSKGQAGRLQCVIDAVIFDLDGVLVDAEQLWDQARRDLVDEAGGRWLPEATTAMLGMSSTEWSAYLHDELGVPLQVSEINERVVEGLLALYRRGLPLMPGAIDAVHRMAKCWPLGLASSSNRPVIDAVLEFAKIDRDFAVTVSAEEVARGKPSPDIYLEAARRLSVAPATCAVIEDSANGIRAGVAAGMAVVAIPNPHFTPPDDVLSTAKVVLHAVS